MARKPLRSQLNQIRAWVRQGRTDAWIAHQLDVSASELREFVRRHDLSADSDDSGEIDLRDEIEAEIEAAAELDEEEPEEDAEEDAEDDGGDDGGDEDEDAPDEGAPQDEGAEAPRRRRRRRGGRGRRRGGGAKQATFDHGGEGYGLWLDPAVADDPVYSEHWAGHRQVEVTIEPDQITIKRSGSS
jgi:hypothetical protein